MTPHRPVPPGAGHHMKESEKPLKVTRDDSQVLHVFNHLTILDSEEESVVMLIDFIEWLTGSRPDTDADGWLDRNDLR